MNRDESFAYFLASFITLNLIDASTTCTILMLGGIELNFFPSIILESFGLTGFFFFKYLGSVFLGLLCFNWQKIWAFLIYFFAVVCCWNTVVIFAIIN